MGDQNFVPERILRSLKSFRAFYFWKLVRGVEFEIPWIVPDPNRAVRPYLEENIGKQGVDWDWKIANNYNRIRIKIRRSKAIFASTIILKWG